MPKNIHIHSITMGSTVNGPGRRNVLHTQGCTLACPGCFNAQTHPKQGGKSWLIPDLTQALLKGNPDGVSISGGEPFQQAEELNTLLQSLRQARPDLSILIFSGYQIEELQDDKHAARCLTRIDVLVDGRFENKHPADEGLRGSQNQRVHLLSDRHTPGDLLTRATEILISPTGVITLTGFPSGKLLGAIKELGRTSSD